MGWLGGGWKKEGKKNRKTEKQTNKTRSLARKATMMSS